MNKYIPKLIYVLAIILIIPINIMASVPETMLYGFRFKSDYYGNSLDGTAKEATITLYDTQKKSIFEQTFTDIMFNKGYTEFFLHDDDLKIWRNSIENAKQIGVFVPEFGQEIIEDIYSVPFSIVAEKSLTADAVEFDNVNNVPEQLQFLSSNAVSIEDADVKSIELTNSSKNNNSGVALKFSADDQSLQSSISVEKNDLGQHQTVIESTGDIIFKHGDKNYMTITNQGVQLTLENTNIQPARLPLALQELNTGNGSALTNINFSSLNISKSDIVGLGIPEENTQLSDDDITAFGYIKTDTNTQLTDSDIAAMGYIKTDTNTQLSDSDIANMGYIKTDTKLTNDEVKTIISAEDYIKSNDLAYPGANYQTSAAYKIGVYDSFNNSDSINVQEVLTDLDTKLSNIKSSIQIDTKLSDSEIASMGYIKTDTNTQLTDSEIASMGYIKTDTNTQLTDSEIALMGYIKTDTNTQLTDSEIASMGYIKTDTNSQLSESQVDTYVSNNGYVLDSDSRLTNARTPVISSQANGDIMFYNDGWKRLAKGNDGEILSLSSGYPTWVTNVVDTDTKLTDSEIASMGYIKTDTNTQLTDSEIASMGYIKTDTNTQLTDSEIASMGYIKTDTNTQLTDSEIASMGYIKTDTNSQLSESQVDTYVSNNGYALSSDSRFSDARIPVISSQTNGDIMYYKDGWKRLAKGNIGEILSISSSGYPNWEANVVDTNTQLTDSEIASMGYIKTDTNTQLSESQVDNYVANNGYASSSDSRFSDARTPVISSQSNGDIMYYKDGWKRLSKGNDGQILSLSSGYPVWQNQVVNTHLNDGQIAAMGYIKTDTNTQLSDADIAEMGYIKTDTNTQLSDSQISAMGYIKTDTNTQLTESQVDAYVANNGYLTSYTDTNTQLSESQVDSYVSNNGYAQASSLNASNINSGTISDSRLPLTISGKTEVNANSMTVENLTVKNITYETDTGNSNNNASSMFGDYKDGLNKNIVYQAKSDGFLVVNVTLGVQNSDISYLYADSNLNSVNNEISSAIRSTWDVGGSAGGPANIIYVAVPMYSAVTIPIKKDHYFKLKSSQTATMYFMGFGTSEVTQI